jgi:hypothetical protein
MPTVWWKRSGPFPGPPISVASTTGWGDAVTGEMDADARLIRQLNNLSSDCPEDAGREGAGRKILVVIGTRSGTGKETPLRVVKDGFPDHAGRSSRGVLPVDRRPAQQDDGRILTVDRELHKAFLRYSCTRIGRAFLAA